MINLLLLLVLSAQQPDESMSFEVLDGALVFLSGSPRLECAEISSLPRFRILLARVQSIAAGFEFPDH